MTTKNWCVLFLFSVITLNTAAQKDSLKKSPCATDTIKQTDIYDVVSTLFNIHSNRFDTAKMHPGKLLFSFLPAIGYTLEASFLGSFTANTSFYMAPPPYTNISVLYTLVQYSALNQLTIPVISKIWLKDNTYELIGDYRFFSYPSKTFGLGSNTSQSIFDNINYLYLKIDQQVLRHITSYYYGGIGYFYDYHWNIVDYTNKTDYVQYNGNRTSTVSSGPVLTVKYDNRTNSNNPDKGFFASILYRYNTTLLGSDNDWQFFEIEMRKYFKLNPCHHIILALWNLERLTWGGYVPYLDLPSIGFGTEHYTGRGYIQGRFSGTDMFYQEGELRFDLTRNGLLGGVVFANFESFTNWPYQNITAIYPGEGAGLRLKFNKYSKVNICVDYALGVQGSRGFFFNLGEVF